MPKEIMIKPKIEFVNGKPRLNLDEVNLSIIQVTKIAAENVKKNDPESVAKFLESSKNE